jgi:photosystem II stability/assembly factor-like uncharacterized protein
MMRRIILVLAVAALMVAASAMPALAQGPQTIPPGLTNFPQSNPVITLQGNCATLTVARNAQAGPYAGGFPYTECI